MSKKVIQVNGECTRQMEQNGYGSFYSTHNQKDIEEYLRHMDADSSIEEFESIFSDDWEDVDAYCVDNFDVSFEETDMDEDDCEYDEDIQKFLDEEPKREIRSLYHQFTEFMGNVQGMKDTASQLLEDCKKVVETGNVPLHLSKDELKMFDTLEGLIKS